MTDIKKIIDDVNASMKIEGMELTESDKQSIERCLTGKTTFDEEVQKIIKGA